MEDNITRIEFDGFSFTRNPDSPRRTDRVYFNGWVKIKGKRIKCRLHRYKWIIANGEIPKGHHIHHKDGNPFNNKLSNLECIKASEHAAHHCKELSEEQKDKRLKYLIELAIPKSKEWHKSEEGREWHRKHARDIIAERKGNCIECGQEFVRYCSMAGVKYCSNKCKNRKIARGLREKYKSMGLKSNGQPRILRK